MSFLAKIFRPKPGSLSCYRQHGPGVQHRCESSKPEVKDQVVMVTEIAEEFDDNKEDQEARIEKIRNKSRLSEAHRNMVNGKLPYPESKAYWHDSVQYKRRMFARYGVEQSQVYPGIAWPDKEDLDANKEYEQVLTPLSIEEMVSIEKTKILEEEQKLKERYDTIVDKLKTNDNVIVQFHNKQKKKTEDQLASKKQKDKLFEEIRQHFGFNIDPRDEKFQEMIEIKKKEELKKRRIEKKKLREEKLINMALEIEKQQSDIKETKGGTDDTAKEKKE
uniref:Large ribosomal subunit protein mL64 n=1 Tax=Cacopsylla melanoneura TaxID=428564 RepID=A0A8D9FEJ8_9HEMI